MSETLGICVATKSRMDHVIGLARAARKAGKEVQVFFTGEGVLLTKDPRFRELLDVAKSGSAKTHGQVTCCEVSYMAQGLTAGKATSGPSFCAQTPIVLPPSPPYSGARTSAPRKLS